jgi:hypothetical protein
MTRRRAVGPDEVSRFIEQHAERHPELRRQVDWQDFLRIAKRDGVRVRAANLSHPARLVRFAGALEIQLAFTLTMKQATIFGMHEICHAWRDDVGEPCFHAEDEWVPSPSEDFAELFSWITTSPSRLAPEPRP